MKASDIQPGGWYDVDGYGKARIWKVTTSGYGQATVELDAQGEYYKDVPVRRVIRETSEPQTPFDWYLYYGAELNDVLAFFEEQEEDPEQLLLTLIDSFQLREKWKEYLERSYGYEVIRVRGD